MHFSKEISKISLDTGAIKLDPSNPFLWASGYRMPIYNDNRLLLGNAKHRQLVTEGFQSILSEKDISIDVVAGTATAGIAPATSLANSIGAPLIYVRPTPKDHGMQNQIEGILRPNQKVVVIEDLISTGGSASKAINAIREAGGQVEHCLSIFGYGFQKATEQFKIAKCQLHQILTFEVLIAQAKKNNVINNEQFLMLQSWHNDPFNWGNKNGFASKIC